MPVQRSLQSCGLVEADPADESFGGAPAPIVVIATADGTEYRIRVDHATAVTSALELLVPDSDRLDTRF